MKVPARVQRYAGEDLGPSPRIAVLGSAKLGNFIVTTPLLRGLKERYPNARLDFYGSPVNRAFEQACPWIDWRMDIFPMRPGLVHELTDAIRDRSWDRPYDLAINCDGFNPYTSTLVTLLASRFVAGSALAPDLSGSMPAGDHPWQRILEEPDWTTPAFLERYKGHLKSNYIAELFCRMAFVETEFTDIQLESIDPGFEVPDVLIHANATRSAKLWPSTLWSEVIAGCRSRGLSVGIVGVAPKPNQMDDPGVGIENRLAALDGVVDLRGQTSPIQLAGAFRRTRCCISVDSGPLHVAAAVKCPTVAIFGNDEDAVGASPLLLWMPRGPHVVRTVSERHCGECLSNRFKNDGCLRPAHDCMIGVDSDQVLELLDASMRARPPVD